MTDTEQIKYILSQCSPAQRREIFMYLRREFQIHPIETELNIQAEIILEAIHRASDLTLRGIRGVIAEASFEINVVKNLEGWESEPLEGDFPYDFLLKDHTGKVSVQVKMQRLKDHRPMTANEGYRFLSSDKFVVETQKTRVGTDPKTGEDTRPYRFGEFDILAVSMHPSTNDWTKFHFTVGRWLMPRKDNESLLLKFQPVSHSPDDNWTDSFETCVDWLRSGKAKTIS